ncbi:hypothetical protein FA13DRAFT_771558 [Coprinellus micaceus]|uniref:Uncharacterized protein n=1 Tax=Coprinellus micaceus TaxID=71717 RepID=A0A4Y7S976_COPMI|nr:hypothetical protein FA13DRAFT_771558 [Coprinellus micaceus]
MKPASRSQSMRGMPPSAVRTRHRLRDSQRCSGITISTFLGYLFGLDPRVRQRSISHLASRALTRTVHRGSVWALDAFHR